MVSLLGNYCMQLLHLIEGDSHRRYPSTDLVVDIFLAFDEVDKLRELVI